MNIERTAPTLITKLNHTDARTFLLKESSYSGFDLPTYFTFEPILTNIDHFLKGRKLSDFCTKACEAESVNYVILNNKDGQYAWRPMQLIHPALYVDLVHKMTEVSTWQTIVDRFAVFESESVVECTSIPLRSETNRVDKAEQITNWWLEVEQRSIELALDYPFLCCTDIVDCYSSVYTHSVAWALHTKAIARANRRDQSMIGNAIDRSLQDMSHGQTNGIPQGSVLADLIAEMVLGFADLELTASIRNAGIDSDHYRILRYRDDYRIFTTGTGVAQELLRLLTTVLSGLGLKINSAKTTFTSDVISGSIKPDKRQYMRTRMSDRSLQKHLVIIHQHANEFPNAGSLARALTSFYRRLNKMTVLSSSANVLLSIATDIAFHNPRCYPHIAAIISKLLTFVDNPDQVDMAKRIRKKIERLPNTGYMQVWLQRATIAYREELGFDDPLCRVVTGESSQLWDSTWVTAKELKELLKAENIIDTRRLSDIAPVIPVEDVDFFGQFGSP